MISIYLPYRAFELGAGAWLAGLVGASGSVVYMFAPFLAGRLSDRFGPKRLLLLGSLMISLLCLSYTFVTVPAAFVGLRLLEGIGWAMIWPPLEALYSTSGPNLSGSLKMFNLSWGLGSVAAPILGSLIVTASSVDWTLLVSAGLMAVVVVICLGLGGGRPSHAVHPEPGAARIGFRKSVVLLSNTFVYGFTITTISTFFPKYAASLDLGVALWGITLSAIYAGRLLAFFFSERVISAMGTARTRTVFLAVSMCFPICAVLLGSNVYALTAASLVTGAAFGLVYSSTLVSVLSGPTEGRGRAAGLFESSLGLGSFVGPALAGSVAGSGLWLTMALPLAPATVVLVSDMAS